MTEEYMTDEERKKFEDRCTIESKEMFIETCRKNGIPDDWYAFQKDPSKPVYCEGLHVGVTTCLIPMQVWDVMFEMLITYKEKYDWEHSDEKLKILSISVDCEVVTARVTEDKPYPFITITKSSYYEKDEKLIADGWERSGYDQYMAEYKYSKVIDIRQWIPKLEVKFRKRTDSRDRMTFGFLLTSMIGYYRYPTPPELLDEIGRDIYRKLSESKYAECLEGQELSSSVQKKMMPFLTEHLIEDEYKALCDLKQNPGMKDTPIRTNVSMCRGRLV